MIVCSMPGCQTSAGCQCNQPWRNPAPHAAQGVPSNARAYTITAGLPEPVVTDEMIRAFVLASDGYGVEKGSFLWEQTAKGLRAAIAAAIYR